MTLKEIETLDTRIVYENNWMKVREDRIRRSSGAEGIYGVVDKPDFVAILPIQDNQIHLVEQYRYPVEKRYWEIPQGSWENDPEANHLDVAAGELREETGLIANSLRYVGHLFQAYGYSNQGFHIYLTSDFEVSEQQLEEEEQGMLTRCINIANFESMIADGTIKDATTICAYSLAKMNNAVST